MKVGENPLSLTDLDWNSHLAVWERILYSRDLAALKQVCPPVLVFSVLYFTLTFQGLWSLQFLSLSENLLANQPACHLYLLFLQFQILFSH